MDPVRTCHCRRCYATILIGHPEASFRERARELASESTPWIQRLLGRTRAMARQIEAELIREHYAADPHRQRNLPARCPVCQHRGQGDLPWWEPGIGTE